MQDRFQMVNKWEVHKVWTFTISLAGSFLNILHFPPSHLFLLQTALINFWAFTSSLSLSLSFPGIINQLLSPSSDCFCTRIYTKQLNDRPLSFFPPFLFTTLRVVPCGFDSCVWPASLWTFDPFIPAVYPCFPLFLVQSSKHRERGAGGQWQKHWCWNTEKRNW